MMQFQKENSTNTAEGNITLHLASSTKEKLAGFRLEKRWHESQRCKDLVGPRELLEVSGLHEPSTTSRCFGRDDNSRIGKTRRDETKKQSMK